MNPDVQAYSIPQFCAAHNISRALFYLLLKDGRAPAIMKLGRRTLVSAEAARAWRQQMTSPSAGGDLRDGGSPC
jgi:predicted DNA-binding transcriptional regulator AlpA